MGNRGKPLTDRTFALGEPTVTEITLQYVGSVFCSRGVDSLLSHCMLSIPDTRKLSSVEHYKRRNFKVGREEVSEHIVIGLALGLGVVGCSMALASVLLGVVWRWREGRTPW